jgi:hypothetical protein
MVRSSRRPTDHQRFHGGRRYPDRPGQPGRTVPGQRDERFLTFGQRPSLTASLVRGRIPGAELAYFQDLYAERLEPREQTLQGCLISKLPMYNGLYRLHRGAEPVEVKQSLGRENAGYADLVVGR